MNRLKNIDGQEGEYIENISVLKNQIKYDYKYFNKL